MTRRNDKDPPTGSHGRKDPPTGQHGRKDPPTGQHQRERTDTHRRKEAAEKREKTDAYRREGTRRASPAAEPGEALQRRKPGEDGEGTRRSGGESHEALQRRRPSEESEALTKRRTKTTYRGIPVVPGIAIGPARVRFRRTQVMADRTLDPGEVVREEERLGEAVRESKAQLLEARTKVAREVGEVEAMIFDAHIAILEDQSFLKKIRATIAKDLKPVEVVVSSIVEGYYRTISMVPDAHIRERAADIRDVGRRLLDNLERLSGARGEPEPETDSSRGNDDEIIFARELLPSDLVALEHRRCQAIICELGSDRGHAAIMLRAMGLPSVMGLEGLSEAIQDGDTVVVDGSTGTVYLDPKPEIVASFRKTREEFQRYRNVLRAEVELPCVTTDGTAVQLLANVSKHSDIDLAKLYNVDGVGLYRSEFHLMVGNSYPDEDEQYWIYREAVERMAGKPVTLRTMDIGSDKRLPYVKMPDDVSHALGRRSIRLMGEFEEFQLIQLRAMLRASAHGPTRLMFPFVTSLEDIRMAKRLLRAARRELDERKAAYDHDLPVGMMVEVPAAALSLDKYVREVQFFSVGTNDLTQYVCAADRDHPEVAPWFKGHNPGMLALMQLIVETSNKHGIETTICGEMAGDPFYTMFLLGIGARRLSMSAPQVPLVKKIVRSVNLTGAQNLARRALQLTSTGQIRELFGTTVQQILGRDLSSWSIATENDAPGSAAR